MNEKRFFKIVLTIIAILFFFTCFSIIFCLLNSSTVNETQSSSHIMSIVYMFLHLLIEAAAFYYSFKALVNGSALFKAIMYDMNGNINKSGKIKALVTVCISSIISIYLVFTLFFDNLFLGFFALGLKFALLNFFILLSAIAVFFYTYKAEEK